MRFFGLGSRKRQIEHDPDRQRALLEEARQRFGRQARVPFPDQSAELQRMLTGDDGLAVAAHIVHEAADTAHADLMSQVTELRRRTGHPLSLDRRNYRPLWSAAGGYLRWSLFDLPLHPYAQIAASVAVLDADAKRAVRLADPEPLLARMFELLDLTIAGWEFGRVRVDTDAASLAEGLIFATRNLRDAIDPPPLPPPVRELMRRNNTVQVLDTMSDRVAGGFNPGKTMRECLLA
ncbi:hypothetical protein [Actinoplanes sp. RD1]|uniref:hypothetical protein n=1 Tax=Actinoplanes sp. RD1 TaxID=3064538 RepID=UPI0027403F5F|nr:hypothetical protein [Actinoplanes sp. RD1]